jgi:uncharacterized protein YhbP (UPF0306 family)
MNAEAIVKELINKANVMQMATSIDNKPWVCNLHFYADSENNLYWISTEARLHSEHIKANPNTAATILIHENTSQENYVIGLSISGESELLGSEVAESIAQGYINKLGRDQQLLKDIKSGQNPHKFYKMKPSKIILFDNKDFPDNPRIELVI